MMKNKKPMFLIVFILSAFVLASCSDSEEGLPVEENLISDYIRTNDSFISYNAISIDNQMLLSYIVEDESGYNDVGYAHFIYRDNGKTELLNIIEEDKVVELAKNIKLYEFSNLKSDFIDKNENDLRIDAFEANNPMDDTVFTADDIDLNTGIFILSNNPSLKKIEVIESNGEVNEIDIEENPMIIYFESIEEDDKTEYKFYDIRGDLIRVKL